MHACAWQGVWENIVGSSYYHGGGEGLCESWKFPLLSKQATYPKIAAADSSASPCLLAADAPNRWRELSGGVVCVQDTRVRWSNFAAYCSQIQGPYFTTPSKYSLWDFQVHSYCKENSGNHNLNPLSDPNQQNCCSRKQVATNFMLAQAEFPFLCLDTQSQEGL